MSAPIGVSFVLLGLVEGTTPVQAFAAGAALCSTSLGTTFTILSTSGLSASRLGVVLSSAAMMDDIVGLVMSGIIARLGETSGGFSAITVIRPVFVSIAFAVVLPLICVFLVKPLTKWCYKSLLKDPSSRAHQLLTTEYAAVTLHTLVLAALCAGASYAGTSVLFAAYLAGAVITWWDSLCDDLRAESSTRRGKQPQREVVEASGQVQSEESSDSGIKNHKDAPKTSESDAQPSSAQPRTPTQSLEAVANYDHLHGLHIFEKYYEPALRTVLKPFFFASIGFAIPITQMFSGAVVWRGIVYTILMTLSKLACGLCLIRFTSPIIPTRALRKLMPARLSGHAMWPFSTATAPSKAAAVPGSQAATTTQATTTTAASNAPQPPKALSKKPQIPKPMSLYPAAMLGSAMVARGEIGFLISSVAESNGVFGMPVAGGSSELYLIVTWAILLCTLIGPVSVGLMVKRVKRLQAIERQDSAGRTDPLGIWGMQGVDNLSREERISS